MSNSRSPRAVRSITIGISGISLNPSGRGLVLLALFAALAIPTPAGASTSHAGWPAYDHLVMDKGPAGRHNVLVGRMGKHNWLLGGYGNDTIYGGNAGDVIWGDFHPSGWPSFQTAVIHAGNGQNFIYSNDTVNYVWTGSSPATVVHAHEGSGVIHCENPHIVVFTSHHALPHYKLDGCRHISFFSVGY
jgi:RTX calcium-binding nonapeptide repeat (4 copies)